jgi:HEAT repeats
MRQNKLSMILFLTTLLTGSTLGVRSDCIAQASPTVAPTASPQKCEEILSRLKDERLRNIADGAMWTLIHDYSDEKKVDEVLKSWDAYLEAVGKCEEGNRAPLDRMGGAKGIKDQLAAWLHDPDQCIRAFAAVMLGMSNDRSYSSNLAALLTKRESPEGQRQYGRGRAALALGLMGANEYAPNLVNLLSSPNAYDRSGAAYGLGWLGAKDQSKAVAKLLNDKDEAVR